MRARDEAAQQHAPAPAPLPLGAIFGPLVAAAVLAVVVELTLSHVISAHVGPAILSVATAWVGSLVLRGGRTRDAAAATTWRGFAAITALLALGQLIRAVSGAGVNPSSSGLSDVALAATAPIAGVICLRLVRSTRGRLRTRALLDAAVALLALGLLVELLARVTLHRAPPGADLLLAVGYPLVGATLCAIGLVTFAGVSAPRRRAAGWLVLGFASLAVAMAAGSLALAMPGPVLDLVTSVAYLAVLAMAALALTEDPGPRARADGPTSPGPLAAVVVSYCVSFGVVLLALSSWVAGRPPIPGEAAALTVLILLTFLRTIVWAAEGARLTRQILRTESYFRSLVDRAADVTLVLDGEGRITWASGAGSSPGAWPARDLEGRPLLDFVHEEDRAELQRVLHPPADPTDEPAPVFRLRRRDGSWRRVESVRTVSAAGLSPAPSGGMPGGMSRAIPDGVAGAPLSSRDGLVLHVRDVIGRRSTELELERLAYTDYLTGLPNRARLMGAMAAARSGVAEGRPSCLLLLDLDGFKPVNDIAGHEAGDRLLVQVATRLRRTVRDRDLVSRLGGDEFAVLVPDGIEEAGALAERIVGDLREVQPTGRTAGASPDLAFDVSASIGVTELMRGDDAATTIRQADLALRTAKAAGKNRVCRHNDALDSATGRRTALARDLPAAIEQGRLAVVYQPVIGVRERRVMGLEALVRWVHPTLGSVPPDEFIPIAEEDGLIVALQRFVLRTATADLAGLLAEGRDLQMGVNISVRHVQAGCLAPDVATALTGSGVPPRRLILELTESVLLDDDDRLHSDLATLRDMGCVVSLDDFGKGHSSLSYLARLPVDILEMDRGFVAGIETDERGAALVASIVELGRTLGMDVVAEGVETTGQLATLAAMGCRYVQGFLLGRPVPTAELRAVIDGFDAGLLDTPASSSVDPGVHMVGRPG
ncbi:MAG: Diguanylate cyclase/phosphodiesterase with sensor(S) [Frankiales bacterium]|nr:Diguanylate cyclase/phosphodiesterase with sensor(S) [Frankiales bacterium]